LAPSPGNPRANTISKREANDQSDCNFQIGRTNIREVEATTKTRLTYVNVTVVGLFSISKERCENAAAVGQIQMKKPSGLTEMGPQSPEGLGGP
jgi:hypothetical protein